MSGINDTTDGRCSASLNIAGEGFQCELAADHNGWSHSNGKAEAVWDV